MAKKIQIFDALMEGFQEAVARKKGRKVALRVTEIPRVKPMRPRQIKRANPFLRIFSMSVPKSFRVGNTAYGDDPAPDLPIAAPPAGEITQ